MNYIVFDLEWNQSPEGKWNRNQSIPCEIVEIGALKLNSDKEIIDSFNELIKPQIYKKMHHITKEILHLKMEELEKMDTFTTVIERFLKWCGEDYIFCTWGPMDLSELQRNMDFYQVPSLTTGPLKFYDIQKLFSIAMDEKRVRRTLENAVDILHIDKTNPFHRAGADAYYTARVFRSITDAYVERFFSIDVYEAPKSKKDEIFVMFDRYSKYISREFPTKEEALSDKTVKSLKCIYCKKSAKKILKWFTGNGRTYYCEGYCSRHGSLKGKIRIRKTKTGTVFIIKTIKSINEEELKALREMHADLQLKRWRKNH